MYLARQVSLWCAIEEFRAASGMSPMVSSIETHTSSLRPHPHTHVFLLDEVHDQHFMCVQAAISGGPEVGATCRFPVYLLYLGDLSDLRV